MRFNCQRIRSTRPNRGFTLVELLIALVTMLIVVGAIMAAYIYGLRMTQYIRPKLSASDEARAALSLLTEDIRSAFMIKIGNIANGAFVPVAPLAQQVGNAVKIQPGMDTNRFVIYYRDATDNTVKRTTNSIGAGAVIANCVSNSLPFQAEDYAGNVMPNSSNNRVIALTLNFYQIQYPQMAVGPGNYYDFYQLRAKVTRRTINP